MRPCWLRSARSESSCAGEAQGLRQDAVSYCLQALQLFEGMEQQRFIAVLSEVAAVGQGGLQINEPGTARSLKNLPGSWSDLALACLIHADMVPQARVAVTADAGSGLRAGDRGGVAGGGAVAWCWRQDAVAPLLIRNTGSAAGCSLAIHRCSRF